METIPHKKDRDEYRINVKRGDVMSNDADQSNNVENQYGINTLNDPNIPDMSDWDKPAGNEDLKFTMLNESQQNGKLTKES